MGLSLLEEMLILCRILSLCGLTRFEESLLKKKRVQKIIDEVVVVNKPMHEFDFSLEILKEEGYKLALSMKDQDLIIDPLLYTNFDYFIVGASMVTEIRKSTRNRLGILSLVEQLLKYHKPIIATDLGSNQAIEIIIKSGIDLVSSDSISSSSEMLLPIDKKKLSRLHMLYDKYN